MELKVLPDYNTLSEFAAKRIIGVVREKPTAVLCLATGDSPLGTYRAVVAEGRRMGVDFSNVTFVALDEWVGIPPTNPGSCKFYLKEHLLDPLGTQSSHTHFFDGLSTNLNEECVKMDNTIRGVGGIDLMLVGIGLNGHVGFNEPGISPDHYSHVVPLEESTRKSGQKYFSEAMDLKDGITLGLKHFMESRSVIMMANGIKKADIILQALELPLPSGVPASIIRKHANGTVLLDKEAASFLTIK